MTIKSAALCCSVLLLLGACSATTSLQTSQPDVVLKINKGGAISLNDPFTKSYNTTSFGQFIFEASQDGEQPMYGLMPLKFNGGYLAADILFFAPAMFFNLREVYPFYEFDTQEGVVRYKKKAADPWHTYTPTSAEIERARSYFAGDI